MNETALSPQDDTAESPSIDRAFQAWFEAARHDRLQLSEDSLDRARQFHYLFVSGFHNEVMPYYFRGNIHELVRLGIPTARIHRIHPTSHRRFDGLIDRLAGSIAKLADQVTGQLVLIGHSRGACLLLATALERTSAIGDRVEALFLIQGPFGGTAIADYVVDENARLPQSWPLRRRGVAGTLRALERLSLRLGLDEGLREMTREASRRYWRDLMEKHPAVSSESLRRIERRSYFITSSIEPERSRFPRSELGRILQEEDGPNDGVVALADQSIAGFGTRLGPLKAGHTDLVWGVYSSFEARGDRRALTRAIVRLLDAPEPLRTSNDETRYRLAEEFDRDGDRLPAADTKAGDPSMSA